MNNGWETTTKDVAANAKSENDFSNEISTYLKIKENLSGSNNEHTYYVTLTKSLSAENGNTNFSGTTELVGYKNVEGRRNYSKTEIKQNKPLENVIKAGNFISGNKEADTGISEYMVVLPPTGIDIKTFCFLIISTIVCLIGFKHLAKNKFFINIKRKKIKNKFKNL